MRIHTINGQMGQRKSHTSFKSAAGEVRSISQEIINPIVREAQASLKFPLLERPFGVVKAEEMSFSSFIKSKEDTGWIRC